ncbi:hypothetical protein DERF_004736 [Dermatophagoides farinae]|uniref:Uncharacterized protein n=1 Tax=Dermatophagoides farinae TaxID=6954 RepID=A0A922I3W6_DERFA|nr:hypothetical protein DERF_004736 [Dermatophagoides farinae]
MPTLMVYLEDRVHPERINKRLRLSNVAKSKWSESTNRIPENARVLMDFNRS